jgi:putative oxidoreductase
MVPVRFSIGLLIARLPIGFFFLIAGANKVKGGIPAFVQSAGGAVPSYLPTSLGHGYLYALPVFEILVGACLILGLFFRPVAFVASLMILSFILAVTGVTSDAGPFQPNVVFLGLALGLAFAGPGAFSADRALFRKPRTGKQ